MARVDGPTGEHVHARSGDPDGLRPRPGREVLHRNLGTSAEGGYENEFAEIEGSGLNIGLHPLGKQVPEPKPKRSITLGLQVDDLDSAMRELGDKGVSFTSDVLNDGFLRLAFFADPDGYPLYICQFNEES